MVETFILCQQFGCNESIRYSIGSYARSFQVESSPDTSAGLEYAINSSYCRIFYYLKILKLCSIFTFIGNVISQPYRSTCMLALSDPQLYSLMNVARQAVVHVSHWFTACN